MPSRRSLRRALLVLAAAPLCVALVSPAPALGRSAADTGQAPPSGYRGQAIIATGAQYAGTEVGGLSGITYDRLRNVYYAIADDRSEIDPARFYTLRLNLDDGRLDNGDVTVVGVTTLRRPDGTPFPPLSLDPESIALTARRTLIISSEGDAVRGIAPFVREFTLAGRHLRSFPVPARYYPTSTSGVRNNLGFESGGVSPSGISYFTATENALVQDGPAADLGVPSPSRLLHYNAHTGRLWREYVYLTDPVAEPPTPSTAFRVNGLVELLPLTDHLLLSLERSFSVGAGNTVKLYGVAVWGATDVRGYRSIAGKPWIRPVRKQLLLDFDRLGIPLDNLEGMTLGQRLPDGRRTLLVVSDNNFSPTQFTQFLLFALPPGW